MDKIRKSMDPLYSWQVPMLYPDTPSFLGVPLAREKEDLEGADVAIIGAPYQGAAGVARVYTTNLLTPVNLRRDSVKYGGYLPEYDLDVFDYLKVVDYGDAPVPVRGGPQAAIELVGEKIRDALQAGVLPVVIGGTEVGSSLPLAIELSKERKGRVGSITLDAHGDNLDSHGGERYCGATWLARMAELENISLDNHSHIGMRGPRNMREQVQWFRERGTELYTSLDIRRKTMEKVVELSLERAEKNTRGFLISVDLDVLDIGCAPVLDEPLGISVAELLHLVMEAGKRKVLGLSAGWLPSSDRFLHWITVWMIVYLLAGISMAKKK